MNAQLISVRNTVSSIFTNSTQRRYLEHTLRVYRFANSLGRSEGADLEALLPAALVHDVGMTVDSGFPSHVDKSRLLGRWILTDAGYDSSHVNRILKIACSHHPKPGENLDSLEEKVIFDADNMEIVGVFGALRWIGTLPATASELSASIDMFLGIVEKCTEARGSLFFTPSANRIGAAAVKSTVAYFRRVKSYLRQFDEDDGEPTPLAFGWVDE